MYLESDGVSIGGTGASPRKFLWEGLCKSWTFYPGRYSDFSEGATRTEQLKVDSLIM